MGANRHVPPARPFAAHHYALAALRYVISRLDPRRLVRSRSAGGADAPPSSPAPPRRERRWLRLDNEALWTTVAVWRKDF
jgi:hypothetical protein